MARANSPQATSNVTNLEQIDTSKNYVYIVHPLYVNKGIDRKIYHEHISPVFVSKDTPRITRFHDFTLPYIILCHYVHVNSTHQRDFT